MVLAHPSGNEFFRHLARSLDKAGLLASAHTCLNWQEGGALARLAPRRLAAEFGRRSSLCGLVAPVTSHPWREAGRLMAGRLGLQRLTRHEEGPFSVDTVYRDFDRWVARQLGKHKGADTAYAYEDAAEATFAAAARLGMQRAYDLPIAYWETSRRLLEEEAIRWPAWEPTLGGTRDSIAKLQRKTHELELADIVVCPSRFVVDSLPAGARASKRIVLAPFGSPEPATDEMSEAGPTGGRDRMRVLFAGGMTQRKGLADLFAAMKLMHRNDIELVIIGTEIATTEFYRREFPDFIHEKPRAHHAVLALMQTCDVFCLPSIVEGRALVIQEAMSRGLPAIVTPNSGADDVVLEGVNGFVVPIRSPAAIAEKLSWCADRRASLAEMGKEAKNASSRFSWKRYSDTIISALLCSCRPAGSCSPDSSANV